jgi:drug/metabolite transporter (DMT)-like permease
LPFSEPGDQVATMESQENQRHVWVGIAWMLLSGLCFVGVNGVVKHLGTDLPAAQSAFIRFAYGAVFFLPVLPGVWRMRLPAPVWRLFGWRGLLHVAAVVFWFHAMARVPVAEMSAIAFLNPVIVLVIAGLLLGERLGPRRVMVVLAALAGAMLVLRPGFREVSEGHLAQIAATLFFAASYVIAKRLAGLAPASVIVAVMSVSVTLGLLPLALAVWQPVTLGQMGWLGIVAALATGGHYAMTRAFEAAPLAVTQPVTFLQIIWSAALGALAFGEPVDPWVIAGGAVIIGAVSVNSWRESRAGRVSPAEPVEA